jgi:hypothetical protein
VAGGVDIGAANKALHQFVGDVTISGQQLPECVNDHGIRAILLDSVTERIGNNIERFRPSRVLSHPSQLQAPLQLNGMIQCRTFTEVGGMRLDLSPSMLDRRLY